MSISALKRWSEWARQDSNLRPLGDQRGLIRGSTVRARALPPANTWFMRRATLHPSRSKDDDKVTVDLGRRVIDAAFVAALFPVLYVAVLAVQQYDKRAGAR